MRDFCRVLRPASPTSEATLIITNIEHAVAYILHPFNATDGKESFAFCEGATLLAKLGSFAVGGRDSYPDQFNYTPPRRIGEAGKLRLLSQGDLRILRRCNFIGEAGKLRLLQSGFPKETFAFCEGVTFFSRRRSCWHGDHRPRL